jgi:serine/threonine-protein kinase SRPK3
LLTLSLTDISGSNLIFTARRLNRSSIKKLTYLDGRPFPLGIPEQLVEKTSWDDWIDEDEEDVRIIDFGQAFLHGAEPIDLAEPGDLQVPEKIFAGHFDYRVDLWRAGCTVTTSPPQNTLANLADIHYCFWSAAVYIF